jgi:HTH-type transcriptional regulator, glycine betaine synthesis regulator
MASFSKSLPSVSGLSPGETQIIAIFVKMAQTLGAPRSLGEIYGLLFATAHPLSFQDIHDRLQLSKGSVSQGLRFLRTVGAIQPVSVEGDRREYFEPVVELRALVGGFLKERINPQLAEWGVRAKALKIEDFEQARTDEEERLSLKNGKQSEDGVLNHEGTRKDAKAPEDGAEVAHLKLAPSSAQRRKLLQSRIEKLKTWQKRADTVLPMVGKLLG